MGVEWLSKKQIRKADEFIDLLSNRQRNQLSFDPGNLNRQDRLVDSLGHQDDLLLSGLDPLA